MSRRFFSILGAALLLAMFAVPAQAVYLIGADSTEGLGYYDAELLYGATSPTEAQITLIVRNYCSPEQGGYITGFALNNPGDQISTITAGEWFVDSFELLGADAPYNAVKATPYGLFDFGAALGGNFLGGGSPVLGLPADYGSTEHIFTFMLTGEDLDQLTEWDFVYEGSKRKGGPQTGCFVVRFKGFLDGGSDKTLGFDWWGGEGE